MANPIWLAYGFAAVMAAVSVYCIGRFMLANRLRRRNHYDVNTAHVLMSVAMVGMLVPRWNKVPVGLWEVTFGVVALYFLAMSIRSVASSGVIATTYEKHVHGLSHNLVHMVMACAMLYMYWLGMPITGHLDAGMSMSNPSTKTGDPSLTLLLAVVLLVSTIWQLDSISRFSRQGHLALGTVGGAEGGSGSEVSTGLGRPWLAPRLEIACHIAMCVTMAYMLVLMS